MFNYKLFIFLLAWQMAKFTLLGNVVEVVSIYKMRNERKEEKQYFLVYN